MDNVNLSYRQFHENFMQNHTGTSVEETVMIQSPIPFVVFISIFAVKYVEKHQHLLKIFNINNLCFVVEFFLIVVLQILLLTLPYYRWYVYMFIFSVGIYLIGLTLVRYFVQRLKKDSISLRTALFIGKRPYITYFRTSVNLTTTICILAVDFVSFPRGFAKTETFGFSLMDTGVGYFVVCNALVGRHRYKNMPSVKGENLFLEQLKQNFLLLILGLSRVAFTKSVDYQSHNTEYGVHWNFFLTLAFVRFLSTFILTFINKWHVKYFAWFVVTLHQLILACGVQDWVISDTPRDNLFSANREGIVSLLGYIGLYMISLEIRNKIATKVSSIESDIYLCVRLFISTVISYVLVLIFNVYIPCSRRLVNVTYIAWIIMLTLFLMVVSLGLEIVLRLSHSLKKVQNESKFVPVILKCINYNALPYFLFTNVLTGVVNLCIETLHVPTVYSVIILIMYMFISCSVTLCLYRKNYKLF